LGFDSCRGFAAGAAANNRGLRPMGKRTKYVGTLIAALLLGCTSGCAFNHVYRVGSAFVRIWSGVIVARDLIGVEEEVESELHGTIDGP